MLHMCQDGDLRVQRTCKLLREAMLVLLSEKPFSSITVAELTQRAMVNRATFYRHFHDKYALAEHIFNHELERLIKRLGPPSLDTRAHYLGEGPHAWIELFAHFTRYERLYRALLDRNGSAWFMRKMRDSTMSLVHERVLEVGQRDEGTPVPEEVVLAFFASAFVGLVAWWFEQRRPYPPEQMAAWVLRLLARGYYDALGFEIPMLPEETSIQQEAKPACSR